MAKLQLKSEQQLLGDMARVILARTGLMGEGLGHHPHST